MAALLRLRVPPRRHFLVKIPIDSPADCNDYESVYLMAKIVLAIIVVVVVMIPI